MLTIPEWIVKVGVSRSAALRWCKDGLIPGSYMEIWRGNQTHWLVPDDAQIPDKADIAKARKLEEEMAKSAAAADNSRKLHLEYVYAHSGTKSVRTIAMDLGITTDEVRRLYDETLKLRGDDYERSTVV